MKRILVVMAALAAFLLSAAQTAESLLGAAIHQEEAEGNLAAAIAGYKKVLAQYGSNHVVAARAQYRLATCYERLGHAEARKAYERVISAYSDQAEIVTRARARLAGLEPPRVASGIAVRQVWADPGSSVIGAAFLDGRYLTATDWKTGDLAIRDLTTGEMRHVTSNKSPAEGNAEESVPSPDGKRIAYGWYRENHGDLRIINTDGSGMKVLYSDPSVRYVELSAWSPDGKQVLGVLQKDNHRRNEMVLVSVSDGSVRVLKTMGFPHFDDMRFSPDGQRIIYSAPQQPNAREYDVFIMAVDGSYDAPLVAHPADDRVLGWSPDGHDVLFSSNRTGATSAWSIRVVDGKSQGEPQLIKKDLGDVRSMGITRQGSLYYVLRLRTTDVYTAAIDPDTGEVTAPAPVAKRFSGASTQPQWSKDGDLLAYQTYRAGVDENPSVVIHDMKTGGDRVLRTEIPRFALANWLPDGTGLIVRKDMGPSPPVFQRIDARTGEASELPRLSLPSNDGKWTFRWDLPRVLARNAGTGEEKTLFSGNTGCCLHGMRPSPDSTRLAVAVENKLLVISLEGGSPRELVTLASGETFATLIEAPLSWLGNSQLVFAKSRGRSIEYWRVPANGGPAQKLDLKMPGASELRVHPDGRRVAFTAGDRKSEVWVMENFLTRSAQ